LKLSNVSLKENYKVTFGVNILETNFKERVGNLKKAEKCFKKAIDEGDVFFIEVLV
jgi:hypothetical protein